MSGWFECSMDVEARRWRRTASHWVLELPFLAIAPSPLTTSFEFEYGRDGDRVELSIVSGDCATLFRIQLPEDAIWSLADFRNPHAPGPKTCSVHNDDVASVAEVRVMHTESDRFDDLVADVRVAIDRDDLSAVRLCMDALRKLRAPVTAVIPRTFLPSLWSAENVMTIAVRQSRSSAVALELCAHMTREEVVYVCRLWRESTVSFVAPAPPGKTRFENFIGDYVYAIHVWDALVSTYALTTSDFETGFSVPFTWNNAVVSSIQTRIEERIACIDDDIRRTRGRLDVYKRELVEKTWHPARLAWCLDAAESAVFSAL